LNIEKSKAKPFALLAESMSILANPKNPLITAIKRWKSLKRWNIVVVRGTLYSAKA
jgi:hypothetical protein